MLIHFLGLALTAMVAPQAVPAPDPRVLLRDVGKIVSPNGIDEAKAVKIGGIEQWITVRGQDRRNPILLVLHGGPASPELPLRYLFERPWTDYFTVVEWDQRGTGKTMALNNPATVGPTISEDRMVADAGELVDYLRRTYAKPKIFVMGHSWGTILGMRLAEQMPGKLYAYIGVGQIIDMRRGEHIGYEFALDAARRDHNDAAVAELEKIAPYPDADGSLPLNKLDIERKWSVHYGALSYGHDSFSYLANAEELSPDYSDADLDAIDAGSALSLPKLLPAMAATDFTGVRALDCPVILFAGRHDYTTPSSLAAEWYARVSAPYKRFVWFENSAHMMFEEEPGRVLVSLVDDALPLASPRIVLRKQHR